MKQGGTGHKKALKAVEQSSGRQCMDIERDPTHCRQQEVSLKGKPTLFFLL